MRRDSKISKIADQLVDNQNGERYVHDPDHSLRPSDLPAGEMWHKTDKGWSSVDQTHKQEQPQSGDFSHISQNYQKSVYSSVGAEAQQYVKENIQQSIQQLEMALSVPDTAYPEVKAIRPPIPKDKKLAERRLKIERLLGTWSETNINDILPSGQEGSIDLMFYDQIKKNPAMSIEIDKSKPIKIKSARDVATLMWKMRDPFQEKIKVIAIGAGDKLLSASVVTAGLLSSSQVNPAVVFNNLPKGTEKIVISHNHPSGDPTPSREDIEATQRLIDSGRTIGIDIVDHVITNGEYLSLREKALLNFTSASKQKSKSPKEDVEESSDEYDTGNIGYQLADWEAVPPEMRPKVNDPSLATPILKSLHSSSGEGKFVHVIKLDTKSKVVGIERISADKYPEGDKRVEGISTRIHRSLLGSGGCAAYLVSYNYSDDSNDSINTRLMRSAKSIGITPMDFFDKDYRSARQSGLVNLAFGSFQSPSRSTWG
jgi:DNA repair protein RadC